MKAGLLDINRVGAFARYLPDTMPSGSGGIVRTLALYEGDVAWGAAVVEVGERVVDILSLNYDRSAPRGLCERTLVKAMADGARKLLSADIAVSVTGLAGPGGDEFGHPVGTVYIGYSSEEETTVKAFCFDGDRDSVRKQAAIAALKLILERSGRNEEI